MNLRRILTAAALVTAGVTLNACGAKAPADDVRAELAKLREEHRALLAEIVALKGEVRRLASGAPEAPQLTEETPGAIPPAPPRPKPARVASAAIAAMLDAYRQAMEAEDLQRMEHEIYGGALPAEDLRYLEIWFDRTDDMQVSMDPRSIDVHDGRADAFIHQTLTYRLRPTAEQRTIGLDVRMTFERRGDVWHLIRVQARR